MTPTFLRPFSLLSSLSSLLLSLFLLLACSGEATPEEKAMEQATSYYQQLMKGDYEAFLQAHADADNLTDSYREQLICAYKQYVYQQKHTNGGLTGIQPSRALVDSTQGIIQVFLLCNYDDNSTEEIVVPMVERNGEWKLK